MLNSQGINCPPQGHDVSASDSVGEPSVWHGMSSNHMHKAFLPCESSYEFVNFLSEWYDKNKKCTRKVFLQYEFANG